MPDGKADGFFVLIALNFGKLQPVVSFQRWDPGDRRPGAPAPRARRRSGSPRRAEPLGVRGPLFLSPTFLIKAEYDMNREKGPALKNNLVQIQAAISF